MQACVAYVDADLPVPRDFLKEGYLLPVTGVASHCDGQLKRRRVIDPSTFADWRKQYEEKEASGAGSCLSQPKKKAKR